MVLRIGVVGYSAQAFDSIEAGVLFQTALLKALDANPGTNYEDVWIVSGFTNLGIPAIAYQVAHALGCRTMGIACAKAADYECYPCDRSFLVGSEWGDESYAFLAAIDVLIRIGGGAQSLREIEVAKAFGIPVIEFELKTL